MGKTWWLYCLIANYRIILLSTLLYIGSIIISCVILRWDVTIKDAFKIVSFIDILKNNIQVILIILLGSFILGVPSFLNIVSNGFLLGGSIQTAIKNGASLYDVLLLLIPHGIFEIPAIIIAGAAGFKIPYEIVRYLAGKKEQILTKEDVKEYLTLALISIILIVIAAWIEANITLKIAKAMLNSTKGI